MMLSSSEQPDCFYRRAHGLHRDRRALRLALVEIRARLVSISCAMLCGPGVSRKTLSMFQDTPSPTSAINGVVASRCKEADARDRDVVVRTLRAFSFCASETPSA